jgi:hypothetical protein
MMVRINKKKEADFGRFGFSVVELLVVYGS